MKRIFICLFALIIFMSTQVYALDCEFAFEYEFDSASEFKGGIAKVTKDGQTAVIDKYGNYIIDFDEREKLIRSNGLIMVVGDNDMAAFFDSSGNRLTDYVYDTYPVTDEKWGEKTYYFKYSLHDGDGKSDLVPFSRNNKYGYINSSGIEKVPPIYGYADGFYNGIAEISDEGMLSKYGTYINGKYGLIKDNGEVIVPSNSYWVSSANYDFEYSAASNGTGDSIIADRYGNISKTDEIGYGSIDVKYIYVSDGEGRKGIKDKYGNFIIPFDFYSRIDRINEDYFILNNKSIVNNRNEIVFTADEGVSVGQHFIGTVEKSRFARISKEADDGISGHTLQGLVNTEGKIILEAKYESAYDLDEGLIYARDLEKNYLFDYSGNLLCELNGNNCGRSVDGVFKVMDFDTMKIKYMLNPLIYPKVYIDNAKLECDVYPVIENDRILIPMRGVFEALGAEVRWDNDSRTVKAVKNDIEISLQIGSNILYKNGEEITIDTAAKIENSRTLIPLRAVSEALGCDVGWDSENRRADITVK